MGGDHPLHHPAGQDLRYAAILWEALCDDGSSVGQRFNAERICLSQHWKRLVRAIYRYQLPGYGPMPWMELGRINWYLDALEIDHIIHPRPYPLPRPAVAEELAECHERERIADAILSPLYQHLGQPGTASGDTDGDRIWEGASRHFALWSNDAFREVYRGIKQRSPPRRMVAAYRRDVAAFCQRWRLNAWWAAPSVTQSHWLALELGADTPLGMHANQLGGLSRHPIVIKLPGRSQEDFERDSRRFEPLLLEQELHSDSGGTPIVVQRRPRREKMARLERAANAACVVVDWDGLDRSIREHILQECEARLGRSLKYREERCIRSQTHRQLATARAQLRDNGWFSYGDGELRLVARWVATLILNPAVTWEALNPELAGNGTGKNRYETAQAVQRACQQFALAASLSLPTKRSGRRPDETNPAT